MSSLITITVISDEARQALTQLKGWGVGEEFFSGIGRQLTGLVLEEFETSSDPWGNSWPDLAPSTIKSRAKRGFGDRPLVRTGDMRDTARTEYRPDGFIMSVGDGLPDDRAWYAQYGTDLAPARPIFPLRNGDAEIPDHWLDLIDAALVRQFMELNS